MIFRLDIEWTCLRELLALARRSPRYVGLLVPMYGRSVHLPRRSQLMRATYFLARYVDDILDGDRGFPRDPVEYVRALRTGLQAGRVDGTDRIARLARFVSERLERVARPGDRPRQDLLELLDAMLFDAQRARERLLLDAAALEAHHLRTFRAALNLALLIGGSAARADDAPAVAEGQATLYTLRDLDVDLARGLVNVPRELIARAPSQGALPAALPALADQPAVRRWRRESLARGQDAVRRVRLYLGSGADRRARRVVGPLHAGLERIAERLAAPRRQESMTWPAEARAERSLT